jgi:hypothetical protein
MQWALKCVHRDTGQEKEIHVDAASEAEAVKQAGEQGYLVESARYVPIDRNASRAAKAAALRSAQPVDSLQSPAPAYSDIVNDARTIRAAADILTLLGLLTILAGAFVALYIGAHGDAGEAIVIGVAGVLYAVPLFILAVLLRLFAGLSNAVRDIAINTRHA